MDTDFHKDRIITEYENTLPKMKSQKGLFSLEKQLFIKRKIKHIKQDIKESLSYIDISLLKSPKSHKVSQGSLLLKPSNQDISFINPTYRTEYNNHTNVDSQSVERIDSAKTIKTKLNSPRHTIKRESSFIIIPKIEPTLPLSIQKMKFEEVNLYYYILAN